MDQPYEKKKNSLYVQISPPVFKPLPDGIYRVRLTDVTEGIGPRFKKPIYIPHFEVCDGPYKSCWLTDMIATSATGKYGKIWRLVRAFSGRNAVELDVFDGIELFDLKGKEGAIHVERRGKNNVITEYFPIRELENSERGHLEAQL